MGDERPPVDVCVPTYNSGKTINKCLECLEKNLIQGDQVTIYDRFSTDETVETVKAHGFKLIQTTDPLGKIRASSINETKKDFVFFLDSDMYLPDHFIENLFKWSEKLEKVGAIQGLPVNTLNTKLYKLEMWLKYERYDYPCILTYRGNTGNTLVSKEAAKGFKCEHTIFEDYALLQYLRSRGYNWWVVDFVVPHDNPNYKNASLWGGAGIRLLKTKPWWKLVLFLGWMPLKAPWGVKTIQFKSQLYLLYGYLNYKKYLIKIVDVTRKH
ncbi:MAG: glycosyltransferase family 2 protein [Candidatus Bathyarchaeia archaeon]